MSIYCTYQYCILCYAISEAISYIYYFAQTARFYKSFDQIGKYSDIYINGILQGHIILAQSQYDY